MYFSFAQREKQVVYTAFICLYNAILWSATPRCRPENAIMLCSTMPCGVVLFGWVLG